MRFLGGFLKFLAILILLAATAGCTAVAVLNGDPDLYWAMGAAWGLILLFVLHILGTGIALCEVAKLRKKLAHYEHRPEKAAEESPTAAETSSSDANRYSGHYTAYRARKSSKKWIIVVIVVILILAALAAAFLLLRSDLLPIHKQEAPSVQQPAVQQPFVPETIYLPVEIPEIATEAPVETAPKEVSKLSLGNSASTDFVEMRFEKCVVKEDIKLSVTTGNVTRITGPDPLSGQQYICLTGKIKNTHNSALPVYDFFTGRFDLDGYSYKVRATDCDILTPDGQTVTKIDPLIEYDFRIYTAIPNELANSLASGTFTFGFYDLFDNQDLAYHSAFSEDPIAQCPYQYAITVK